MNLLFVESNIAIEGGGASSEMIDNDCGIVVEDNDISTFETSLERLISDEDLRIRFSNNSKYAADKFSVDNFMRSWEQLVQDSLNNR